MTPPAMNVDPADLERAATDLDAIANRLERSLPTAAHAATLTPQGRDEVSVAVAASFTTVAGDVTADAGTGVLELRKIAAALRAQAVAIDRGDDEIARAMRV